MDAVKVCINILQYTGSGTEGAPRACVSPKTEHAFMPHENSTQSYLVTCVETPGTEGAPRACVSPKIEHAFMPHENSTQSYMYLVTCVETPTTHVNYIVGDNLTTN